MAVHVRIGEKINSFRALRSRQTKNEHFPGTAKRAIAGQNHKLVEIVVEASP